MTTPLDRVRDSIFRYGLVVLLVALVGYFAATQESFGTARNALIILQSVSITAIVALGVTVSLAAGGFDLSVGSTVSFVVMITAVAQVYWALPPLVAVLLGLASGAGIGLVNGLLVVVARVPDLLATLGTMFVFAGLSLVFSSGQSVAAGATVDGQVAPGRITEGFTAIGRGTVLGLPTAGLVMLVLGVAVGVFLSLSRPGRLIAAVGSNPVASRLAGVRVGRYRMVAYLLSGTLASVGGVLLAARLGRGDVGAGSSYLLEAVAAALIGFAVLGANRPNALGTVVGAVFVGVLLSGLTMNNVPYYTQDLIKGLLLIGALVLSFSAIFRREGTG